MQQKNIVQGSISNVQSVEIGDTINYTYNVQIDNAQNVHIENAYLVQPKTNKNIGYIPPKPSVFLGRENSPEEIHKQLCENSSLLLLVNGEGGIGKTTLASVYYHKYTYFYKHLIWLVAENGIRTALSTLAVHLNLKFEAQSTAEQQMMIIVAELKNLDKPVLLILDNADKLTDLEKNYAILRQLPNVHILLTSRIEHYDEIQNYKVNTLSEEHAIQLFKQYFKNFREEETPLLKKLLPAVGYNTLVVELLAKNLNNFNDELEQTYPLQKLLNEIQQKGVLAISKTDSVNTDWKLKKAKPDEIVLAMYDIAKLTEEQQQILSVFAVLPPIGVPYKQLKQFLPDTKELNIKLKKLSQEGWCNYDEQTASFKTNPLIAEVTRKKSKDRIKQDIIPMLSAIVKRLDYEPGVGHIEGDFEEIKQYVAYAENIARYPKFIDTDYLLIFERLGNFYQTYGNLDKALKYFEDDAQLTKELYESYPNNVGFKNGLAISYSKLGETHSSLGNLDKALKYFEERSRLGKELYESYPNNVGFKNGLAISYVKLGFYHQESRKEKAKEYFQMAEVLFKELAEQFSMYPEFIQRYEGIKEIIAKLQLDNQ